MNEKLPEHVFHQFDNLFDKMDGAHFGEAEIAGILYGAKNNGIYPGADYVYRYIQCLQIRHREQKERTLHQKYKRCLAMAWWCGDACDKWMMRKAKAIVLGKDGVEEYYRARRKLLHYMRWQNRWMKFAEKFKEAK